MIMIQSDQGLYHIHDLIGTGSFGNIMYAEESSNKEPLAVKVQTSPNSNLAAEAEIYQRLVGAPGFPIMKTLIKDGHNCNLVMELLGQNLSELLGQYRHFSLKTVLIIADQLLARLHYLHSKGYIHCDIKPDNIVIGRNNNSNVLYLIDYGLSQKYIIDCNDETEDVKNVSSKFEGNGEIRGKNIDHTDLNDEKIIFFSNHNIENHLAYNNIHIHGDKNNNSSTITVNYHNERNIICEKIGKGNNFSNEKMMNDYFNSNEKTLFDDCSHYKHVSFSDKCNFVGSAKFASTSAHRGWRLSRRDDMESLGYLLVYLLTGQLPWSSYLNNKDVYKAKVNTSVKDLCDGLPPEFEIFLNSVRCLEFDDKPNYAKYRELFRRLFIRQGFTYDYVFDWTKRISHKDIHNNNMTGKKHLFKNRAISKTDCSNKGALIKSKGSRHSSISPSKGKKDGRKRHRLLIYPS
ncbi:hypothetical protein TRFO_06144 [Tritrichomonas foetus]|uniref:non-specific serine/threonine protein kinase n=1 Tax=Tritrichomonas foetus TaxID=1144522 RepID=A0A1J4JZX8_9EUKA|nr:hypothetical protein TRFO_06144 [Tritrichomonas foetus]|eukprot:OHT04721.1 hypothetical protein TRFO_06144 [Tritrichomonas foetus]